MNEVVAATSTAVAATPVAATANWFDSLDEGTKGYVQNNGYADKDPVAAFAGAAKAHQELFKHFGVPGERLLTLPADQNPEAWKAIYQRLGAPADATGYDLSTLKHIDPVTKVPTDLDPVFVKTVQDTAASLNLPATQAVKFTEAVVKYQDDQRQAAAIAATERTAADVAALKASWGQNYEANRQVAVNAFKSLGATAEQLNALETIVGGTQVMELLRNIGSKMGEDGFVQGSQRAAEAPKTVDAAKQSIETLMADTDWVARWSNGGANEQRELDKLMRQAHPDDYAAAGV